MNADSRQAVCWSVAAPIPAPTHPLFRPDAWTRAHRWCLDRGVLVMLDLDNTLADRQRAVAAWTTELCSEHGLPEGAEEWVLELDNDGYSNRRQVLASVTDRFGLQASVDQLVADYQRRVVQLTAPTAGAIDCLVSLRRRGCPLALVTNGSSGQQHAKIDALGFRDLVDAVCVSEDLGVEKPSAEIFETAANLAGASLDGAWMVGDSPLHDIDGARRLGVQTAWLRRGRSWGEALPPPTVTIDSLEHFVSSIDNP